MIAVITGDIIGSKGSDPAVWLEALRDQLDHFGSSPKDWEVYRGDEFQLEVDAPDEVLLTAFRIKASIKTFKNLDVRMGIGIGEKDYQGSRVSQSNGSAFVNSGTQFDLLKKQKVNLAISSPDRGFDQDLNMLLKLALVIMDDWSVGSAQLAQTLLENPDQIQEEIARKFKIKQAAVSQRLRRAHLNLIMELEAYFRIKFNKTFKP